MAARGFLFAVAALALVAAGCGNKGKRISKSEFVSQAQSRMAGISAGDEKRLASSIENVLPVIRKGNDDLRSPRRAGHAF